MPTAESTPRPVVLIVDDDFTGRLLERETLEQSGFAVDEAPDGETALDMLDAAAPDLVLLDVDMPGVDGFEVCRQIRARWSPCEMPVIMVTGMDDLASINHAYEVGANDFMSKPINWPVLGHRTRYVLRAAEGARIQKELEQKQAAIVRAIPDMLFTVRRDGLILDAKAGAGAKGAIEPDLFIGRTVADVLPGGRGDEFMDALRRALDGGMLQSLVFTVPSDGRDRHYEARIARSGSDKGVTVVRDITREKLNEEKIRRLAYYDPLTGMPNRQHFLERLAQELERTARDQRQLALLFLDLDGFKRINDTLGHGAGDALLRQVATRLKEKLRISDIVSRPGAESSAPHLARLGGDEFVIVLPSLDDAHAATDPALLAADDDQQEDDREQADHREFHQVPELRQCGFSDHRQRAVAGGRLGFRHLPRDCNLHRRGIVSRDRQRTSTVVEQVHHDPLPDLLQDRARRTEHVRLHVR